MVARPRVLKAEVAGCIACGPDELVCQVVGKYVPIKNEFHPRQFKSILSIAVRRGCTLTIVRCIPDLGERPWVQEEIAVLAANDEALVWTIACGETPDVRHGL